MIQFFKKLPNLCFEKIFHKYIVWNFFVHCCLNKFLQLSNLPSIHFELFRLKINFFLNIFQYLIIFFVVKILKFVGDQANPTKFYTFLVLLQNWLLYFLKVWISIERFHLFRRLFFSLLSEWNLIRFNSGGWLLYLYLKMLWLVMLLLFKMRLLIFNAFNSMFLLWLYSLRNLFFFLFFFLFNF